MLTHWLKSPRTFPQRIFVVALILRLVPVLLSYNLGIGLDDMFQYDMLARSIVAGNGYRWYARDDLYLIQPYIHFDLSSVDYDPRGVLTSFRPPLYPAFLALVYFLTGADTNRFFTARLAQAFIGAVLVPLTYTLARRCFTDDERVARRSAWIVAVYPMLVIYPLSLATENIFFLLVLGSMLALLKAAASLIEEKKSRNSVLSALSVVNLVHRARWFILSGILLGLTALTRSVSLVFAALAVLWVWFVLRERKMALFVFLAVTAVTLPWMVRNTLMHHRMTGIESALGYNLYVGYHPQGTGTFQYPQSLDLLPMLEDGKRDAIGQAKAWDFIRADPSRVPYLAVRRLGYFFGLERRALTYFYSNNYFGYIPAPLLLAIAAILLLPFVVISTSAVFGLALTRWRTQTTLLALFLIGYLTPHVFILAEDRFHLTFIPFLAVLAVRCWTGGRAALRLLWKTTSGRLTLTLAGLAVLLLLLNWSLEIWRDAAKISQLLSPAGNMTYFPY